MYLDDGSENFLFIKLTALLRSCNCFSLIFDKNVGNVYRSSCPEVFCKTGVLKNFAEFIGKRLCQSLFFNKVATLFKRDSGTGVVNFVKFLRTPFFIEHLRWLLLTYIINLKTNELFIQALKIYLDDSSENLFYKY